jgi:serine/threonine protein kinase
VTQSSKKGKLSLIQSGSPEVHAKSRLTSTFSFVSYSALEGKQKESLHQVIEPLPIKGIITAFYQGEASWDTRLLLLIQERLFLLRFFSPYLLQDPVQFDLLERSLRRLSPMVTGLRSGTHSDGVDASLKFWTLRPYLATNISHRTFAKEDKAVAIASQVVDHVTKLHAEGLTHGHITSENIFLDQDAPVLVDYFHSLLHSQSEAQKHYSSLSLAPEWRGLRESRPSYDIYGLGLVLKALSSQCAEGSKKLYQISERLLLPHSLDRYSLESVRELLYHSPAADREEPIGRGVLLSKNVRDNDDDRMPLVIETVAPHVDDPTASRSSSERFLLTVLLSLLAGLLGFIAWTHYPQVHEEVPLQAYWESGRIELMTPVAAQAISADNNNAREVILQAARANQPIPLVKNDLLKRCFDTRWTKEPNQESRDFLFRLVLLPFLAPEEKILVVPKNIDPGILFGFLSLSTTSHNGTTFKDVLVDTLFTLPAPYGKAFLTVTRGESWSVEDPRVIALARLFTGDAPSSMLPILLSPIEPESHLPLIEKLLPLLLVARPDSGFTDALLKALAESMPRFEEVIRWYSEPSPVEWAKVSPRDLLLLASGTRDQPLPSTEHTIDLLTFPWESVRSRALEALLQNPSYAAFVELLILIHDEPLLLSRAHVLTLVGALSASSASNRALLHQWLLSKPRLESVARVIAHLEPSPTVAPLLIMGAQYVMNAPKNERNLLRKDGALVERLITSKETLVRSLGYLLLEPGNAHHSRLLATALREESNPKLHQQLVELAAPFRKR